MTRREVLKYAGRLGIGLLLGYPLYAFVVAKRFRPPREIRIRTTLRPGRYLMEPDFALFETDDGPLALSRHCTHLGCILNYREGEKIFLCPCHQSRFTWDGKYLSGPAKKDLVRLTVRVMEDEEGYVVEIPRRAV
jgi:cytochrome b6-f complex iron-sulfur subunit